MTSKAARRVPRLSVAGMTAFAALLALPGPARAIEFEYGEVSGSFLNTLSAGAQMRVEDRDARFVSAANGGPAVPNISLNADDGNLNFNKGDIVSAPLRLTSELDVKWQNFGFYGRGTMFYDALLDGNDLAANGPLTRPYRGRLNPQALDAASKGAEVLDLYVRGEFDVAGNPLNLRVGQQTVTWGEALVTQNGINIINPVDVTKLTNPGAEVRDGLIPVPMVFASYRLMQGLSVEGFYQWQFRPLRNAIPGTFFSGTDVYAPEAVGLGGVGVTGDCGTRGGLCFREGPQRDDDNEGNFGFATRYFAQELNSTEFGLYYAHYTSRYFFANYYSANDSRAATAALRSAQNINNSSEYLVYPKNIQMFGGSFNTSWDETGMTFNGELSYKKDVPAGIQSKTVVFDAINRAGGLNGAALYNQLDPGCGTGGVCRHLGIGGETLGYTRVDAYHLVLRGTKSLFTTNPVVEAFGADSASTFVEASAIYIPNMPDPGELMLSSYVTNAFTPGSTTNPFIDKGPTRVSAGATGNFSLQYLSAFGTSVNLTPSLTYQQGLHGAAPIAGGYQSGFKAANLALRADYLVNLSATVNYATRWGGGIRNYTADRDFVGLTVNYQF